MTAQTIALQNGQGITWERSQAYQITMRQKIDTGRILDRLVAHVLGKIEMTATEIQAARILLGKTMPDLQAIAVNIEANTPASKADIDAMLMAAGLSPESEWDNDSDVIESVPVVGSDVPDKGRDEPDTAKD
jgi:hypothetical protein